MSYIGVLIVEGLGSFGFMLGSFLGSHFINCSEIFSKLASQCKGLGCLKGSVILFYRACFCFIEPCFCFIEPCGRRKQIKRRFFRFAVASARAEMPSSIVSS